ncbi:hypothetical protein MUN82_10025 [Hymenobacter aerilatus]|uniref:DUF541 domain-containing protein n=1 Tax=Hymenobacter aerilatus TaxID=2932251 RepID=A0A8T9T5R5_9BACT|nr:hypothetical protein [Hymenobacter aerilatus]UOR07416.1 hypothetical protein MUN82_10025 [Hymenobacter aerilatus]
MKKLFFMVGCLLVLGSSPVLAQAVAPQVIIVRVEERQGSVFLSIARGSKEPEETEFQGGAGDDRISAAAVHYQKVIAKLYQEGYSMQGMIPGQDRSGVSTLIFVKGPKR